MKPTRILSEPTRVLIDGYSYLMLNTDVGEMLVKQAAEAVGLRYFVIIDRLASRPGAWADEDIFAPRRKMGRRLGIDWEAEDIELIAAGRRDHRTIQQSGSCENLTTDEEQKAADRQRRLAQKRRDDEYRDHLKHHRAMCR
jgi:hypothetical protein